MLSFVLLACAAVIALIVVYVLETVTQAAFAEWSGWLQAVSVGAVVAVVWIGGRILWHDRATLDEPNASRRPRERIGMLPGRRRRDARAIEAIREQILVADTQTRAALANGITRMSSLLAGDLEQRRRSQAAAESAIDALRQATTINGADLSRALDQVAGMWALVAERIEADRLERRALTEVITAMGRPDARPVESRSRVLGDTPRSLPVEFETRDSGVA
jgi:hypothetical protein